MVKPTVYIVTEAVMPLSEKIKELDLTGVQRCVWGLTSGFNPSLFDDEEPKPVQDSRSETWNSVFMGQT